MTTGERTEVKQGRTDVADFYPTPDAVCTVGVALLPSTFAPLRTFTPGVGSGAWGRAIRARYPDTYLRGVEIRDVPKPDDYDYIETGVDFRTYDSPFLYDLVVSNPPFGYSLNEKDPLIAETFVLRSREMLHDDGYMVFLLRSAFAASIGRYERLFSLYAPESIHQFVQRPSFTGNGSTDMTEYSIFVWRKNSAPETRFNWLSWR